MKNLLNQFFSLFSKEKAINRDRNEIVSDVNDLGSFVTVSHESNDPDENVPTPANAKISFLDAQALKFWNKKTTDYEVPAYYAESAFGRNVLFAKERLLKDGFLAVGDLRENISLKTIPDLKAVLAERELRTTGKKAELVQRLLDYVPEDELQEIFSVGKFYITDLGMEAIEPYSIIQDSIDHSLGFSYYRLLQEKEKTPQESNNTILTRLLSEDIQKCYRTNNKSEYQRVITNTAKFMMEIGEYENALNAYILSFAMWIKESQSLQMFDLSSQSFYLAKNIESCAQYLNFELKDLLKHMSEVIKKSHPFGIGTEKDIQKTIKIFTDSLSIHL